MFFYVLFVHLRYAEMEEDCRQKKSTLTPAPRGREEVAHSFRFCVIGFVVGVIVDVV